MTTRTAISQPLQALQMLLLLWFAGFGYSCKSTQLAPEYAESASSAIQVDSLTAADPSFEAYILPYKTKLDARMDSIIGYSLKELQRGEVESALGNFVADLVLEAAREVTDRPIDMSVITIGGLRMPLPEGPIRMGDIFEVLPFENKIVVLELSGEQANELFKFAARKKITAIANTKLVVKNDLPLQVKIGAQPFDPHKSYTLATHDYLAGGGDNMEFLKEAKLVNNTDILIRSAIVNKIVQLQQAGKKIDAAVEGRVVILP